MCETILDTKRTKTSENDEEIIQSWTATRTRAHRREEAAFMEKSGEEPIRHRWRSLGRFDSCVCVCVCSTSKVRVSTLKQAQKRPNDQTKIL